MSFEFAQGHRSPEPNPEVSKATHGRQQYSGKSPEGETYPNQHRIGQIRRAEGTVDA
jgi:hypothetical protein